MYYNLIDVVVVTTHNTIYATDNINVTTTIKLVNVNDNCFTKNIEHTNNITNNITRHNHTNYEHNVITQVTTHIKHINNYDTDINYYSNKSLNQHTYYTFYHDNFNFRKMKY